jgi:hypothetical protein
MSFRYYDLLEDLLRHIDLWRGNREMSKDDVLDSTRERVLMLMTHVISTPLIGTAYAYPGDIKTLQEWVAAPPS